MFTDRPRDLVSNGSKSDRGVSKEIMSDLPLAHGVSQLCCSGGCCRDLGSNQREGTLEDEKDDEGKD